MFAEGDIDMVLLAFGVLGDQAHDEREPLAAVRVAQTNYTGAVSAGLVVRARPCRRRGTARWSCCPRWPASAPAAPTSSTARSKAGLDAFAQGLGDALHGTGVHVMVVRPGFVRHEDDRPGCRQPPLATDAGGGRHGHRAGAAPPLGDGVGAGRAAAW